MEFLKKNWVKLAVGAVALTGFIIALLAMINVLGVTGHDGYDGYLTLIALNPLAGGKMAADAYKSSMQTELFTRIAMMITFLGIVAIVALRILEQKKLSAFVAIAVGTLALIFLIIAIAVGGDALEALKVARDAKVSGSIDYKVAAQKYDVAIYGSIINILVFGCMPILHGIKGLFCKCCKAK